MVPNKKEQFVSFLNFDKIDELINLTDNLSENIISVSSRDVDKISDEIKRMLKMAACQTGMIRKDNGKIRNKTVLKGSLKINKPWFNEMCKNKCRRYIHAKQMYRKNNVEYNLVNLKHACKDYKKQLSKSKFKHSIQFCTEIRAMKSKKPKEFWALVNKELNNKAIYF